ncbi:LysR family transcriptional regulator [Georgfuchsia toluolica]|uniref:LysR family transcriptional regulator n=1 Tax=Georgfuchsia toluolica TaxID=424218 RepID=A0A916N295_9PROT|nr:DUF1302 family protein [Georgfuchsia toluolica]CAG4882810.1 LysR family transcriptional regulator [Georgfuchsia toluolica]CAG4883599.1 LysR family transcriptional regulator [Georgfuchsia toluolica]
MNKPKRGLRRTISCMSCVIVAATPFCSGIAQAADTNFYGDASAAFSWNVQNTLKDNYVNTPDTKHKLSMERYTLKLNADTTVNENLSFVTKVRFVSDVGINYLENLQDLRNPAIGVNGADITGHNNLSRYYSGGELRELYADIKPIDNLLLRLGKQQVVWGESDFFQAMDIVQGYDFTWRSFLEAPEDLRKPSVMANVTLMFPEIDGKLQALFRPGSMNRLDSIGNTLDFIGGRWAVNPYKGIDFRATLPYNYRQNGADEREDTWGLRWSGIANEINYSVSYLKTFNQAPVFNMTDNAAPFLTAVGALPPGVPFVPSGATPFNGTTPAGIIGEIIYPKIELFGLSLSGYSAAADAVFSAEAAYIRDYAFNFGNDPTNVWQQVFGGAGFAGIMGKDVIRSMLRMDKNLPITQTLLGTEKPAFFSLQLFDTWIQDFNESDNIVNFTSFGQHMKEHSPLLTMILNTSYMNGVVTPSLVAGADLAYGGGFIVPGVELQHGKNWRLKLEYDYFWHRNIKTLSDQQSETALFGYFANNNQLYARLTYQF